MRSARVAHTLDQIARLVLRQRLALVLVRHVELESRARASRGPRRGRDADTPRQARCRVCGAAAPVVGYPRGQGAVFLIAQLFGSAVDD